MLVRSYCSFKAEVSILVKFFCIKMSSMISFGQFLVILCILIAINAENLHENIEQHADPVTPEDTKRTQRSFLKKFWKDLFNDYECGNYYGSPGFSNPQGNYNAYPGLNLIDPFSKGGKKGFKAFNSLPFFGNSYGCGGGCANNQNYNAPNYNQNYGNENYEKESGYNYEQKPSYAPEPEPVYEKPDSKEPSSSYGSKPSTYEKPVYEYPEKSYSDNNCETNKCDKHPSVVYQPIIYVAPSSLKHDEGNKGKDYKEDEVETEEKYYEEDKYEKEEKDEKDKKYNKDEKYEKEKKYKIEEHYEKEKTYKKEEKCDSSEENSSKEDNCKKSKKYDDKKESDKENDEKEKPDYGKYHLPYAYPVLGYAIPSSYVPQIINYNAINGVLPKYKHSYSSPIHATYAAPPAYIYTPNYGYSSQNHGSPSSANVPHYHGI